MERRRYDSTGPEHPRYVLVGSDTPTIWRLSLAAVIVVVLLGALYAARTVVLPLVIALLFSFLLSPIVRFLHRFGLPEMLGAALVVGTLLVAVASAATLLAEPTRQWLQRAPEAAAQIEHRLQDVFEAFRRFSQATREVQQIATGPGPAAPTVIRSGSLSAFLIGRTWQFAASMLVTIFLLYFLLATGPLFLRKLVKVMPRFGQKRLTVIVIRHIEHDVSQYLLTVSVINTVLGVVVGSVMFALQMPNALLWGVMAGLLNFIPYLGPLVTLLVLTAVAILTFDSLAAALLRPAAYLALTTLEGQVLTPLILGRRLLLNPVVIFVNLIFWAWLWGIVGALIAVPLAMIIKILCDAIPPLRPFGELLSK